MTYKDLLILGDSTSMSIGLEREMYPFQLADAKIWDEDSKVYNCSLPGFTSADATAFFYKHSEIWKNGLRAVIIYLGNCDTASTEVIKGKYGRARHLLHIVCRLFGKKNKKIKLRNKLLHFQWNNNWNGSIEIPELATDFKFNLRRIIKTCRRKKIPVILVRPKANRLFLPGVGKGNFLFYRFLNVEDSFSKEFQISDMRFKDAMLKYQKGEIYEASQLFQEILANTSSVKMSREYSLMIVNNYAVTQAELENISEAKFILEVLLKEKGVRSEIIYYNLAQINKKIGEHKEYLRLMDLSYESDVSMYRVRSPYINVLNELAKEYPEITMLDMEKIVPDEDYLDHCHPLFSGQKKLSNQILINLNRLEYIGEKSALIKNIIYNPELAFGNTQKFYDYFKTDSVLDEAKIHEGVECLIKGTSSNQINDIQMFAEVHPNIAEAFIYHLRHPCFPSLFDLLKSPPKYSSDIGRFPEYFLVRHVIPYLRKHEKTPELMQRFSADINILRNSNDLMSILPDKSQGLVSDELLNFDNQYGIDLVDRIIVKTINILSEHLHRKNQIFERVKTLIFWYVREALRFGAHSRYSMFYDRLLLENLAEGLAVAGVIDMELNLKRGSHIIQIIKFIESTTQIHENFCREFKFEFSSNDLLNSYDDALMKQYEKLKGEVCTL
jgi:hypothetical protein